MTEAWSATVGSSASTAVRRMTEVPVGRESAGAAALWLLAPHPCPRQGKMGPRLIPEPACPRS